MNPRKKKTVGNRLARVLLCPRGLGGIMNTRPIPNESAPEDKVLVIAESNSASESWTTIGRDERDEAVAIFQQLGESSSEFSRRAVARIARLQSGQFRPRRAIFALQNRPSEGGLKARAVIARALVAALCSAGGAELVLAGHSRFADSERHELLGLVEALNLSLAGQPMNIRVRLAAAPPAQPLCRASGVPQAARHGKSWQPRLAVGA
jgi:hypothetical protein